MFLDFIKRIISYKDVINKDSPIDYWANDPSINLILQTTHKDPMPAFLVDGYKGGGYQLDSNPGRAAGCHALMNNCLDILIKHKPENWILNKPLKVYPAAGVDLNAFYDRNSLKFFYYFDKINKKNTYSCESSDIVTHEFGHAMLDAIRPDFWNVQSYEIWALHESFGDIIAIINILNNEKILEIAIKETKNNLFKSNTISRLAEHFAKTVYNVTNGKSGIKPNSLRDACNNFAYTNPKNLPEECNDQNLSRECHSFSRIMTGCLYEILIEIYNFEKESTDDLNAMKIAKNTLIDYLFLSIKDVPCTNKIFKSLCQKIIQIDKKQGSKYKDILFKVFEKRNLLTNIREISTQNFQESNQKTKRIKVNYKKFKSLTVEIPFENKLEYDQYGYAELFSFNNLEEGVEDAGLCINSLFESKMIGNSFKIKNNNIIRKKIIN